ncbi:16S rRNA (guanine(527)-N(7))-methyltransferase RsmG [Parvularcula marina]|uniref:Ribosomal RNA small subunit methyltransferase G n=1 Tax=Parvularcula marina TaxID=2292771 RepID=A0A371RJ06_9PROT|nr:16S rRNA (guanine(527)-N(7))-methyltransferase RsmG [Parvularcula marina]RFB05421.1 16S rRNA (guanine(527)-N(7))-methyltransferase RsmG [Parvularcula marina]
MAETALPRSLDEFADRHALDAETRGLFAQYDERLLETAAHTNVISRNTLPDRWARHYEDSAQLFPLIREDATTLLDIGSGAGFPGLVLGILCRDRPLKITLADSVGKKARFLAETAHALGLSNITVSSDRVESFHVKRMSFDVITARAVTALDGLLALASPLLAPGGMLIFPKGARADEELTAAATGWRFNHEKRASHTDPDASILILTEPERR